MSTANPSVSIVTVVLNNRDGLRRTEESISRQTSREYEWVVVDGGSSDGSLDVVRGSNVKRLKCVSEPDRGIYDAMNKGAEMASGEYVLFLNSGDRLAGEKVVEDVDRLIGELPRDERIRPVITGGINLVLSEERRIYKAPRSAEYIWHSTPGYHQATLFPLGFVKHNPYDTSYGITGDYYISALAYKLGLKFVALDLPISDFEVGGYSYQHPLKQMREAIRVQRAVLKLGSHWIFVSAIRRTVNVLGVRTLGAISSLSGR